MLEFGQRALVPCSRSRARGNLGRMHAEPRPVLGLLEAGRVLTAFCEDVGVARSELRRLTEEQAPIPTLVTLEWASAPSLTRELDEIRDALAGAAKALWPNWYITADERFEGGRAANTPVEQVLDDVARLALRASPSWLRAAWRSCEQNQLPLAPGMTTTEQVRQLALALDPSRLIFSLSVESEEAHPARLRGLAKAAGWLANQSHSKTLLLVPTTWQGLGELDHVNYRTINWPTSRVEVFEALHPKTDPAEAVDCESSTRPPRASRGDTFRIDVGPIAGKPHPGSEVEQALYGRIVADPELATLFEYNQRLEAFGGKLCIVDLVWRAGGLIVELDGPEHHGQMAQIRDKDRDYRLLMSGYITLRIANAEIYTNEDRVLEKIKNVVGRLRALGKAFEA